MYEVLLINSQHKLTSYMVVVTMNYDPTVYATYKIT